MEGGPGGAARAPEDASLCSDVPPLSTGSDALLVAAVGAIAKGNVDISARGSTHRILDDACETAAPTSVELLPRGARIGRGDKDRELLSCGLPLDASTDLRGGREGVLRGVFTGVGSGDVAHGMLPHAATPRQPRASRPAAFALNGGDA